MERSKIEWCDHSFNPWLGCTRISSGCANCYAERMMDTRFGRVRWGDNGTRVKTSAAYWRTPERWNRRWEWYMCDCGWRGYAGACGHSRHTCPLCSGTTYPVMQRVFAASLADIFEDRHELRDWRQEFFALLDRTPHLLWLLLTKRPQNIRTNEHFGDNVWIGTTVEHQMAANTRLPAIMSLSVSGRFVSMEPLLGYVDITPWLQSQSLSQVIVGAETGPGRRQMNPDWARNVRDQCRLAGVPFFMKGMGGDPIPDDLRIREFPPGGMG